MGFPTKAAMTAMNGRWAWEEFEAHTDASIWSEVKFIWTFSWLPWGSPANDLDKWKNSGNMGPYLKIWYLDTRLSLQDWRNRWMVSGHLISGFFQLAKKASVDESKRWFHQVPEALAHHCLLAVVSKMNISGWCLLIESHFARGLSPWSLSLSPQVWRLKLVAQIDMRIRPECRWKGEWLA